MCVCERERERETVDGFYLSRNTGKERDLEHTWTLLEGPWHSHEYDWKALSSTSTKSEALW
jgi:hypothetical protein